jgi:hypothetical protein
LKVHEQAVWRVNARVQSLTQAFAHRMELAFGPNSERATQELLKLLPEIEVKMSQNNQDQEPS